MTVDGLTNFIIKATENAAKLLVRDYVELEQLRQVSTSKNINIFVLNAIKRTKKLLSQSLGLYPESKVVFSEEFAPEEEDENTNILFYVIPIEGVSNFIYSIPFFSIVVVAKLRGIDVAKTCVVNFPLLGEICCASCGRGAWSEKIRNCVSYTDRIKVSQYFQPDSPFVLVDRIKTCFSKIEINNRVIYSHNIKILGSITYSIYLVIQNKADIYVANNINYIFKLMSSLLSKETGVSYQEYNEYYTISSRKMLIEVQ